MKNWKQKYDYVADFNEGRAGVKLKDKFGHVNKNGRVMWD